MEPIPVPGLEVVDETPLTAAAQMALDEVQLDAVAGGRRPPLLRFWGWTQPALVIGSNQAVANEVDLDAVARHGFTVVRRLSGGGTMLAEPGRTITWSLVMPVGPVDGLSFVDSFAFLDRWAVETLRALGVELPVPLQRGVTVLAGGAIPVTVLLLGMQLADLRLERPYRGGTTA